MQLPTPKAVSFIDKTPIILESIDESPRSRSGPRTKVDDTKALNFESLAMQHSVMDIDMDIADVNDDNDDDDGLPKVLEATDIFVKKDSDEIRVDLSELGPPEDGQNNPAHFSLLTKQ